MKTLVLGCMAVCVAFVLHSCCKPDPNLGSQAVISTDQHQSNWCWAASGEMCMEFLGSPAIQQCDEANKSLGRTDCCNSPTPTACNQGGWPEFPKYGFSSNNTSDAPISFDEIKNQIYCKKVPFCNTWHWAGGGGHMMVISGYSVIDGVQMVYLRDPLPVGTGSSRWLSYTAYVSGPGYTHWNDYYNIKKN